MRRSSTESFFGHPGKGETTQDRSGPACGRGQEEEDALEAQHHPESGDLRGINARNGRMKVVGRRAFPLGSKSNKQELFFEGLLIESTGIRRSGDGKARKDRSGHQKK